jgi:hypothetical protein
MTVTEAMKKQGMRYFSSLTPIQKDRTVYLIVKAKLGLLGLSDGLARAIMNNMIDELLQTRQFVDTQVKGRNALSIKVLTH